MPVDFRESDAYQILTDLLGDERDAYIAMTELYRHSARAYPIGLIPKTLPASAFVRFCWYSGPPRRLMRALVEAGVLIDSGESWWLGESWERWAGAAVRKRPGKNKRQAEYAARKKATKEQTAPDVDYTQDVAVTDASAARHDASVTNHPSREDQDQVKDQDQKRSHTVPSVIDPATNPAHARIASTMPSEPRGESATTGTPGLEPGIATFTGHARCTAASSPLVDSEATDPSLVGRSVQEVLERPLDPPQSQGEAKSEVEPTPQAAEGGDLGLVGLSVQEVMARSSQADAEQAKPVSLRDAEAMGANRGMRISIGPVDAATYRRLSPITREELDQALSITKLRAGTACWDFALKVLAGERRKKALRGPAVKYFDLGLSATEVVQ